jgi:hypothetical protein
MSAKGISTYSIILHRKGGFQCAKALPATGSIKNIVFTSK